MPPSIEMRSEVLTSPFERTSASEWKLRLARLFLVRRRSGWRFPAVRTSAKSLCVADRAWLSCPGGLLRQGDRMLKISFMAWRLVRL